MDEFLMVRCVTTYVTSQPIEYAAGPEAQELHWQGRAKTTELN